MAITLNTLSRNRWIELWGIANPVLAAQRYFEHAAPEGVIDYASFKAIAKEVGDVPIPEKMIVASFSDIGRLCTLGRFQITVNAAANKIFAHKGVVKNV